MFQPLQSLLELLIIVIIEDSKTVSGFKTAVGDRRAPPNSGLAVAFLKLRDGTFDGYIPHRFFGKAWVLDVKCLASIILIVFRIHGQKQKFR